MNKRFKNIAFQLHLWLGGISGIVVFIVCITGAIWAIGIHNWLGTDPEKVYIDAKNREILAPSVLIEHAQSVLGDKLPNSITYTPNEPTNMRLYNDSTNLRLSLNPYTGEVLDVNDRSGKAYEMKFWDYMRWGHRALWLPWDFGRKVVNYGTLLFLIVLVSGLIIWMPKSWKGIKNRVSFNWKKETKVKRKLYDLHLVLGFYSSFLLILICSTGMVWGINWWSQFSFAATTGKSLPEWINPISTLSDNTKLSDLTSPQKLDKLFNQVLGDSKDIASMTIQIPKDSIAPYRFDISHDQRVLYNYDALAFDQYTLEPIITDAYYSGKYIDKSFGEKLRRQNYDLHIGRIWGPVGEVLIFFAALFGASLPLTGYYILFVVKQRHRKKKKK